MVFNTSWGWAAVLGENRIRMINLPYTTDLEEAKNHLKCSGTEIRLIEEGDHSYPIINNIRRYFQGHPVENWGAQGDISTLTPFTQQVLEYISHIPYGATKTYGEVAKELGRPRSARAVGQALGRNPLPLLIPCHRVLAQNGGLGGFTAPGGVETKRALLALENIIR